MTFLSSRFLIVVENRVLVNQKTFLVEKRKSAPLTITGIVSNANANRDTQGAHAVSSFCVVITYHKTRSGVFKRLLLQYSAHNECKQYCWCKRYQTCFRVL